jgi:amino acid transporter
MLCLSIMVREIDIDKLGPQAGWELAENLIRVAGGLVWLWLLVLIYQKRQWHWPRRTEILITSTSLLTGAGVVLYIASWFFDKSVVPLSSAQSQLWEETLQLSGTIFLFTAGLHSIPLRKIYLPDPS